MLADGRITFSRAGCRVAGSAAIASSSITDVPVARSFPFKEAPGLMLLPPGRLTSSRGGGRVTGSSYTASPSRNRSLAVDADLGVFAAEVKLEGEAVAGATVPW